MKVNILGQFLQYYRKKYNLNQEELCKGICSISTLSRVENGSKMVDLLVAESLLGRIGKEVLQFEIMLNDNDYYMWTIRQEIQKQIENEECNEAKKWLSVYKTKMPKGEPVHEQMVLYYEAQIKLKEQASVNEICDLLYKALRLTKTEIEDRKGEKNLYNTIEIELIILLLRYNHSRWKNADKERILLMLFYHVEEIYSGRKKEKIGIEILLELIGQAEKSEEDLRIVKYVDKAVEFISRGRGIDYIGELHFIKAKAFERLYHGKDEWREQERMCKEEALMAYYVFDVLKYQKEKQEVQQFCEDRLGWQIIE